MSIEYHMLRWRRWNLLRNGTPQGARCNLGKLAQSEPDADDVAPLSDSEAEAVNRALCAQGEVSRCAPGDCGAVSAGRV